MRKSKKKQDEKFTNEVSAGDDLFIKNDNTDYPPAVIPDEPKNDLPEVKTETPFNERSGTQSDQIQESINGGEINNEKKESDTNVPPDPEPIADQPKPQKKKGRGRPKKTEKPPQDEKRDLLDLIPDKEPEPITPQTAETQPKRFEVGKYISGSLVLLLIDSVVPGLLLLGAKKAGVSGLENVQVSDIALDSHEKKELEPLAHEAVKEIMAEVSPGAAFLVAITVIYGGKLMLNRETE